MSSQEKFAASRTRPIDRVVSYEYFYSVVKSTQITLDTHIPGTWILDLRTTVGDQTEDVEWEDFTKEVFSGASALEASFACSTPESGIRFVIISFDKDRGRELGIIGRNLSQRLGEEINIRIRKELSRLSESIGPTSETLVELV